MPELPEVEALADHLRRHAVGLTVGRIDVAAFSVLKTFDPPPPLCTDVRSPEPTAGASTSACRSANCTSITHLSRAGWLRWSDKLAAAPLKPGKGPIALRVHLGTPGEAPGFDLTEAGTQKRLAVWLVTDPMAVPQIASLGPDALSLDPDGLAAALKGNTGRIKTVITDQKVIAGIGNAYSDEILHVAKLSPFATAGKLTDAQLADLHDAMISVLDRRRVALRRPTGRNAQGREAFRAAGACPHRAAVPGLRGHRARGVVRRQVIPVLPDVSDRRQGARRPADVQAAQVVLDSDVREIDVTEDASRTSSQQRRFGVTGGWRALERVAADSPCRPVPVRRTKYGVDARPPPVS